MARKTSLTSLKQISEINLTPLMDLTFILLITFIITFPLIEQGISVNLPKHKADTLSNDKARTVSVDRNGSVYFDEIPVTLDDLAVRLGELSRLDPEITVMIRADEEIRYGYLVKVLKVLHNAGIAKMALVTEADGKPEV